MDQWYKICYDFLHGDKSDWLGYNEDAIWKPIRSLIPIQPNVRKLKEFIKSFETPKRLLFLGSRGFVITEQDLQKGLFETFVSPLTICENIFSKIPKDVEYGILSCLSFVDFFKMNEFLVKSANNVKKNKHIVF